MKETKVKIFNILAMKAEAKPTSDWLSKAKEIKEIAASKAPAQQENGTYEKLPSIPLKFMQGSPEEPEILVVKMLQSFHPANTAEKTPVAEIEVLYSECKRIANGKYNMWFGYKVLNDEMQAYMKQFGQGAETTVNAIINDRGETADYTLRNIDGQTFVIAMLGEATPKKGSKNRPAKLFRVFPPP